MVETREGIGAGGGSDAYRPPQWTAAARGATLLEVLIVAVVLLVGMYSVLRVFPVGFGVVERGGYITLANRYAHTLLEELSASPERLPDGILPAVYARNAVAGSRWPTNEHALRPTDLEPVAPGPGDAGLQGFRNSLVQFRKIYQETTRVPRASASTGNVSRYVLRFSPIEYYSGNYYDLLVVYSLAPYYHVDVDDQYDSWTDDPRYDWRYRNRDGYYVVAQNRNTPNQPVDEDEVDPTQPLYLVFSGVDYDRTFKVDFAIVLRNPSDPNAPAVQQVTDKIVYVPASPNGDPVRAQIPGGGGDFSLNSNDGTYLYGSAVVRRRYREGRQGNDPYWYELDDTTLGVLRFNPAMAGSPVGIDYSVMDWGILHDDVDAPLEPDPDRAGLPANEQRAWVKLSFPYIDMVPFGAVEDPVSGIQVYDNRPGMDQPIIIQNIDPNSPDYGLLVDPSNSAGTWTMTDTLRGTDESKNGRIGLLVSQFNQPGKAIRRIRIFYRTRDGFAAQVFKPFASYTQAQTWAVPPETDPSYNRYVVDRRGNGEAWLIFALADVGNAVSVDYTYEENGVLRKVVGEMHTIQEENWGGKRVGKVILNTPTDAGDTPFRLRSVDAVRGMSLTVRVSWAVRGTQKRIYFILREGWANQVVPSFWEEDGRGRLQLVGATAVVAKPRFN
ncbi:MAG: hypothetical protein QHJ73_13290 [Armatimonadota bacterium]|nr:hypothetical protein [Armatimonadota bacterium]